MRVEKTANAISRLVNEIDILAGSSSEPSSVQDLS